MDCGSRRRLNRAVCLFDFWRCQEAVPGAPSTHVSDANLAYRREALAAVAAAWDSDFHETVVNGALRARGD